MKIKTKGVHIACIDRGFDLVVCMIQFKHCDLQTSSNAFECVHCWAKSKNKH